ncbi:hypothetical protein NUW58_g7078 [Xylaria curta]|uniref:Uncharacterized protein n=1 Tax=Xylaria curta TaxID=42375 RepID=A0ACC1NLV8_9PEZI|nr:hypothetical protein NUW58_g7078 [Xylaria curta]
MPRTTSLSHGLVTNDEKAMAEGNAGSPYLACKRDRVLQLSDTLAKKKWIGFDLDDTLHEFRRASTAASIKVLEAIREKYGVPFATLKSQYDEILRWSFKLTQNYKMLGKKAVVITEGPQDAQEWTVENLGISPYVDYLATTNHFKISKTDGLFNRVLERIGIAPSDVAYVGDNEHRDVIPAIAEGIFSFHFAETLDCDLEACPPRISSLSQLEDLILCGEENTPQQEE